MTPDLFIGVVNLTPRNVLVQPFQNTLVEGQQIYTAQRFISDASPTITHEPRHAKSNVSRTNTRSACENIAFAAAKHLRNWREQRPSKHNDPDSRVTEVGGRVLDTG
jgi:phytoene dehydrogenase-like protein